MPEDLPHPEKPVDPPEEDAELPDDPEPGPAKRARIPVPAKKPERPRSRINTVIGDYEVSGELGRGGMGVVYRARQMKLNRPVALKMLTGHYGADELQRFLAESQTAAGLHHTNIVHIYEVGEIDGSPFFSMEFVEGGSLADKLRKAKLPPREVAEFLLPVARALHFAHQHGIVHRDIKPHNILIDPEGVPKIADFGIAKRMNDDSALTVSGAIIGTPAYMAPEQAGGTSRHVGPGADIYSLGVILYEMLTGRPPFISEESETPLHIRVHTEEITSPAWHNSEIPRELEVICMKCLQKDPRDRYNSAAAFAEDLRRYLDDEPILAKPPSRITKTFKWVKRHPWKFTLRAAVLALLIAGAQWLWHWEGYVRPHIEYAGRMTYVWGGLEPLMRLTKEQTAHFAVSLRLTRQGRFGPVIRVEVLNARGRPAITRRLLLDDPIPLLTEGIIGAQPFEERLPETTRFEMKYEKGRITEMKGWDRIGSVNWRMIYDADDESDNKGRSQFAPGDEEKPADIKRARFADLRGFNKNKKAASFLEYERNAQGYDQVIRFFNGGGEPAANGENVYGYRIMWDSQGRVSRATNIDVNWKPMANRNGLVSWGFTYGASSLITKFTPLDGEGKPTLWGTLGALASEYNDQGQLTKLTQEDANEKPLISEDELWTFEELTYDQYGEITGRKFIGLGADGKQTVISDTQIKYDEFGHPEDIRFTGAESWHTVMRHDEDGKLLEETYLGPDGKPINVKQGFASRKSSYQLTKDGLRQEDTYFDEKGEKTYNESGYHLFINEYSTTGILKRQTMDEHDPRRFTYYRMVNEPSFDDEGRIRQSVTRYENQNGELTKSPDLPYNEEEQNLDEKGRDVLTWQSGWSLNTGAPVWCRVSKWYEDTTDLHSEEWQAYDEKRHKIKALTNLDPAYYINEYSEKGVPMHRLQAGYNEAKLGYFSREWFFSDGKLIKMVYRRSDGTEITNIRTLVHQILPDAQPVILQELRVGDQLVSANGVPVTNPYMWTYGSDFPGGYIEIKRNGQPIRIDGIEGGTLGVYLEDRGPDVP